MAIRFDKNYNQEIQKTVRAYNAKLARLAKDADYEGVKLPAKTSVSALKSKYATRYELNKALASLKRLGSTPEIIETKSGRRLYYEYAEKKQRTLAPRRYLAHKQKILTGTKIKVAGSKTLSSLADVMPKEARQLRLRREQLSQNLLELNEKDWDAFDDLIDQNTRVTDIQSMQIFQSNMIKAFEDNYRYSGEWVAVSDIAEAIKNMSPEEFYYRYQASPEFQKLWETYYNEKTIDGEHYRTIHALDDDDFENALTDVIFNYDSILTDPLI